MTKEERSRRQLDFRDLNEVVQYVEKLHVGGYEKVGNWDLAQVCGHLSDWMRFPLDGYPRPSLVVPL